MLISHSILGNITKFLVEKLSTSDVISQKPHQGGRGDTPSAFSINLRELNTKSVSESIQCDKLNQANYLITDLQDATPQTTFIYTINYSTSTTQYVETWLKNFQ